MAHNEQDDKFMTFDDFAKQAIRVGHTLTGFVSYDLSTPDLLFFGLDRIQCPSISIPRDFVELIELRSARPCLGGTLQMWEADLVLKHTTNSAILLTLIGALGAALKRQATSCGCCTCKGGLGDFISICRCQRHCECHCCHDRAVACNMSVTCQDGHASSVTGMGSSADAAKQDALDKANKYCANYGSTPKPGGICN